jgi:hypothetical protein
MYEKLHRARLGAALLGTLAIVAGIATVQAASSKMPAEWDGLMKRDSKGIDALYVLPEAVFTGYTQVIVDPVNVEFHKNWKKDMNDTIDISRKVDADDIQRIRTGLGKMVQDGFKKELSGNGYPVVTEPAANTLRVTAHIVNLYVNAPDIPSAGRVRTYTTSTGEMTLVLELRDSVTGQSLARAVDHVQDQNNFNQMQWTNSVSNAADADLAIRFWAKRLRQGLDKVTGKTPAKK